MQSEEYKKRIQTYKNLDSLDPQTRRGIELSIADEEADKAYLRFYASRLKKIQTSRIN